MENLIYHDPAEIEFDLSGWDIGDTMFDRCSVRVQGVPSTTRSLDAPLFMEMRKSGDGVHVSFGVNVVGVFPNENVLVELVLFSFPLRSVEVSAPNADAGVTWHVVTNMENALATELGLGKLTMASVCEYEPITRMLPGNINTAEIRINFPRTAYAGITCEMDMYPAPGVIVTR